MLNPLSSSDATKAVSPCVKSLIYLHLVAIASWCLPVPAPKMVNGQARPTGSDYILVANEKYFRPLPLKFYMASTGFWQYWSMFAPDPAATNVWCDATVIYQDGSQIIFAYPRMAELGVTEKFFKERYRKFYEHATDSTFPWQEFALSIARLNDVHPNNPFQGNPQRFP